MRIDKLVLSPGRSGGRAPLATAGPVGLFSVTTKSVLDDGAPWFRTDAESVTGSAGNAGFGDAESDTTSKSESVDAGTKSCSIAMLLLRSPSSTRPASSAMNRNKCVPGAAIVDTVNKMDCWTASEGMGAEPSSGAPSAGAPS